MAESKTYNFETPENDFGEEKEHLHKTIQCCKYSSNPSLREPQGNLIAKKNPTAANQILYFWKELFESDNSKGGNM